MSRRNARYFRHGLFPQLVVFEAVARLGSATRAAEELHLAQPTVSTQLAKLSRALDVTLHVPDGRGLRLTEAGQALAAACGELIDLVERTECTLSAYRESRDAAVLPLTLQRETHGGET